jgi:hypothetical protein
MCGKKGVLPNRLQHIKLKVSSANSCEAIKIGDASLTHPTCFEGQATKLIELCCWVCHGRFHHILPKECSRSSMGTI